MLRAPFGLPFQSVLTWSFLGDFAGRKSEGMEGGGERVISWCLFFFFFPLSSNHPAFMITEILQISTVGKHHYNKYR